MRYGPSTRTQMEKKKKKQLCVYYKRSTDDVSQIHMKILEEESKRVKNKQQ